MPDLNYRFEMLKEHLEISVKPNGLDRKIIRLGWILVILNLCAAFAFYFDLPDKIPTHFNLRGQADGFGDKSTIWVITLINLGLYYGLNLFSTKLAPHKHNYPVKVTEKNALALYAMSIRMLVLLNTLIALLFLLVTVHIVLTARFGLDLGLVKIVLLISAFVTVLPFYFIFKMMKVPK